MILLISLPVLVGSPRVSLGLLVAASLAVIAVGLVAASSVLPPILPLAAVPFDPVDSPVRTLSWAILSPAVAGGAVSVAIGPILMAGPGVGLRVGALLAVLVAALLVLNPLVRPVWIPARSSATLVPVASPVVVAVLSLASSLAVVVGRSSVK